MKKTKRLLVTCLMSVVAVCFGAGVFGFTTAKADSLSAVDYVKGGSNVTLTAAGTLDSGLIGGMTKYMQTWNRGLKASSSTTSGTVMSNAIDLSQVGSDTLLRFFPCDEAVISASVKIVDTSNDFNYILINYEPNPNIVYEILGSGGVRKIMWVGVNTTVTYKTASGYTTTSSVYEPGQVLGSWWLYASACGNQGGIGADIGDGRGSTWHSPSSNSFFRFSVSYNAGTKVLSTTKQDRTLSDFAGFSGNSVYVQLSWTSSATLAPDYSYQPMGNNGSGFLIDCLAGIDFTTETIDSDRVSSVKASSIPDEYDLDNPEWNWTGYGTATATFTGKTSGYTTVETAIITNEITTAATCTATGTKVYTATVNFHGRTYNDTKNETLSALGHDYYSVAEVPATCEGTGMSAHYGCSRCDKLFTYDGVSYTEVSAGSLTIAALGHDYYSVAEVPATCEGTGVAAHYACSRCDKLFTYDGVSYTEVSAGSLTIAATGHTYGEWIDEVPAEIGVAGTLGHYHCSVCDKDFDTNHVELNSLVIPALDGIKWVSLSLNGDIGVNFYAYVGGAASLTANDGALVGESVNKNGIDCFKFTVNVAAKDYKKNIAISIDGTEISATYKVETYIDAITNESPAYDLVQSLKVYCEAARAYFADETPAAAGAVDIAAANAAAVTGDDGDITLVGATLILETKTAIKVYFKAASLAEKTFTVNGAAVVPEAVDGYTDLYMITIDNIAAQDLEVKYTIVVGGYTISYSALSYAYAVVNNGESSVALANVAKALYNYNVQANAYAVL
ncbi:MAG: hypothetical protein J6Y43_00235 [Clostridia bacterium]|nr:hypothetical protein [Clostridia bacterium]